jgi:hypothetical protein
MQIKSSRRTCYPCDDQSSAGNECSLRWSARRDNIDYRELLPNGEVSQDILLPRIPYQSLEAVRARRAFKNGIIPQIPDHVPTTLRGGHEPRRWYPTKIQVSTAITEAVATSSIPSGSTITPDPTPDPQLSGIPASASLRVLQMVAERELETTSDLVPFISAERDQTLTSRHSSPEPEMIDLTHSSESSSPPSSEIEPEPPIQVAGRVRHPMIKPTSDSAMIDRTQSPDISSSINSRPRVSSETVFHLIAINNSKDPRAHEASTLRFQERQMSVRVYSNQYDGSNFDYGPSTRDSAVGRGPEVDSPSTSGVEDPDFAGTENERLLEEIDDMEMEEVRMNSQRRRERLKASAKVLRELKGDVGYEKALGRELQKKRKEQQARNDEIDGELVKSEDLVMMYADNQARPNPRPDRSAG